MAQFSPYGTCDINTTVKRPADRYNGHLGGPYLAIETEPASGEVLARSATSEPMLPPETVENRNDGKEEAPEGPHPGPQAARQLEAV